MQMDFSNLDLIELRDDLEGLREELENELAQDPDSAENAIPLLTSIRRLQGELKGLKSNNDIKREEFLKWIPDLYFITSSLNQFADDDGFEDEDFDEDDDFQLDKIDFEEVEDTKKKTPKKKL